MTVQRYTLIQRLLHWLIAVLVFGLLTAGLAFWGLGYEGLKNLVGDAATNSLYTAHKSFGILILVLTIVRLALRRVSPPPPYDPPLGMPERMIGGTIHLLLYILLIGLPIGGWIATAASGYPIEFFSATLPGIVGKNPELGTTLFFYHGLGGLAVFLLVVIHMAAGLKHWKLKDGIMTRISLP